MLTFNLLRIRQFGHWRWKLWPCVQIALKPAISLAELLVVKSISQIGIRTHAVQFRREQSWYVWRLKRVVCVLMLVVFSTCAITIYYIRVHNWIRLIESLNHIPVYHCDVVVVRDILRLPIRDVWKCLHNAIWKCLNDAVIVPNVLFYCDWIDDAEVSVLEESSH